MWLGGLGEYVVIQFGVTEIRGRKVFEADNRLAVDGIEDEKCITGDSSIRCRHHLHSNACCQANGKRKQEQGYASQLYNKLGAKLFPSHILISTNT